MTSAAILRDCIGELAVASPLTLREAAQRHLAAQHPACARRPSCDACHVHFTLARMLHTIATTSELGNTHELPPWSGDKS